MAEEILVDDQIKSGEMTVDRLLKDGVKVTVAFWVKNDEGLWRLYIASPEFDDRKPGDNYLAIRDSLGRVPNPEVRFWPINLINNQNPIARDALKIAAAPGEEDGTRYRGTRLGDLPIEEAYIYPKPAIPLRQEFTITYVREGKSDEWSATTRKGEIHRWVRAKGAVSYMTAWLEGERPGDVDHAQIYVFVKVNPSLDERALAANPAILNHLVEQARSLADRMFKEEHPDATIHHDDEVECED
jgi:hypothetical protein